MEMDERVEMPEYPKVTIRSGRVDCNHITKVVPAGSELNQITKDNCFRNNTEFSIQRIPGGMIYMPIGRKSNYDDCKKKCLSNTDCEFFIYEHNPYTSVEVCELKKLRTRRLNDGSHTVSAATRCIENME